MSNRLPENIRAKIADKVFQKADDHHYLEKDRPANSQFMDSLVKDGEIGVKLQDFMAKDAVKTYIKDGILNRYSKIRRALPKDVDKYLVPAFGKSQIEVEYVARDHVSLHRMDHGGLVVVGRTTYIKWETGLRKVLLYIACASGLPPKDGTKFEKSLIIFHRGIPVNSGDKTAVSKAVELANMKCIWGH
ncbi:MAG: hypothetical protein ACYCPT_12410 [Acidimicrobiales bacterium]